MRAEEAAAHSWREARLDRTAAAAKMSAVELPFVEAAPLMSIAFANGTEDIPGVALAFLCLDRANDRCLKQVRPCETCGHTTLRRGSWRATTPLS
jgi:hypothetical protein